MKVVRLVPLDVFSLRTALFSLFSLFVFPALLLFCLPETARAACKPETSSQPYGETTALILNLRSTPKRRNNIIKQLPHGQEIIILEKSSKRWIHVQETTTCLKGWVKKRYIVIHKKKIISPIFLNSSATENMEVPPKPAPKIVVQHKKIPKAQPFKVPLSNCMKKLRKKAVGYGRVRLTTVNILSAKDIESKIAGSFPQGELLTILETSINWFYVAEENSCSHGWIPRSQITNITIEHPLYAGRTTMEPEPLTPCLIKLKQDEPIGFGVTKKMDVLHRSPQISRTIAVVARLRKGQPLSIMRLDNNWLEVVEESSCISGWIPYESVYDITFIRPKQDE